MTSKSFNQKTLQRNYTQLQRENNILNHRITQLEAQQQTAILYRKQINKHIEQIENSRESLEQDFNLYKQKMDTNMQTMKSIVQDKDRQLSLLKTQNFTLEQNNQSLQDNLRAAQQKINYLLRQLTNRNNFIKEALQRKQYSQNNSQ